MWTNQIQETLNSKKHGDTAFRAKDFATAIESYTEVRHSSEIQTLLVPLSSIIKVQYREMHLDYILDNKSSDRLQEFEVSVLHIDGMSFHNCI